MVVPVQLGGPTHVCPGPNILKADVLCTLCRKDRNLGHGFPNSSNLVGAYKI